MHEVARLLVGPYLVMSKGPLGMQVPTRWGSVCGKHVYGSPVARSICFVEVSLARLMPLAPLKKPYRLSKLWFSS